MTGGLDYLPTDRGWWAAGTRLTTIALPTVFLPVALLGMALPALMERAGRQESADAGRVLGRVLAVNVVGCVAGALAAGFVLPSLLGLWRSTATVGLVIAVAAAVVLHRAGSRGGRARVLSSVAIVVALAALFTDPPRVRVDPGRRERLVALLEGTHGITAVLEDGGSRRLKLNNWYVLGGTAVAGDERRQAHVPLLLHRAPHRVAFLGLGSGITASGALFHPVEQLTVVELVPEVARAAEDHLGDANLHVLRDPRTHLVVDDARGHLRGTPDTFDVVVGDLVVPWRPGESALFTLEHFEAARRVLAPGGTFCQWSPLFQLTDEELHSILRTFLEVFPRAQVWRGDFSPDEPAIALVAGRDGVTLDPALVARRLREMRPDPENAVLAEPAGLWLHLVGILDRPEFESAPEPINREIDPWIETRGPLARGRAQARMTGRRAEAWMAEVRRRSGTAWPPSARRSGRPWRPGRPSSPSRWPFPRRTRRWPAPPTPAWPRSCPLRSSRRFSPRRPRPQPRVKLDPDMATSARMPALFFGHGNPMNAIQDNAYTEAWAAIGRALPRPRAILSVSAHWYLPGTLLTAMDAPAHHPRLRRVPARAVRGRSTRRRATRALAQRVQELLAPVPVALRRASGASTTAPGRCCATCSRTPTCRWSSSASTRRSRRRSTTSSGAGSRRCATRACWSWAAATSCTTCTRTPGAGSIVEPLDWAVRFERRARELMRAGDHGPLVEYEALGTDALLSVAHARPLPAPALRPRAAAVPGEAVTFPVEGFDGGSVSMLSVRIG